MGRRSLAREITRTARELSRRDLVLGTNGNVSARTVDGFCITPSRLAYRAMRPRDLVWMSLEGEVQRARRAPSLESPLHAAIYRGRPDVGAVVHTHSLYATAWSFRAAAAPLRLPELEELGYYGLSTPVAVTPPAEAGSPELAELVVERMGRGRAVLMGHHGVLSIGLNLEDALNAAMVLERQAAIAWLLETVGEPAGPEREAE